MSAKNTAASQAWLFLGPEIGEKQAAIDEIRKKLSPPSSQSSHEGGLEETVYYAGDTAITTIVSRLRNASLFASARLFLVKSAEEIKKKDDIDLLSSYLASPLNDASLILISDESKGIAKGLEKSIPPSNTRIFWELSDSRKYGWVRDFFRKERIKISPEGIDTILELVENNTAALKQECSRLLLFIDREKEFTAEDAEKWLSHTREETTLTLFSRIAAGDFSRSMESLRLLLAAKEATVPIFAALATDFRKLMSYLALKEKGITDNAEYKKIGVSAPAAKRDYAAAAGLYDSAGAEKCLALTIEYDMLLRSSLSFPAQILMDRYLYKIHSLASGK